MATGLASLRKIETWQYAWPTPYSEHKRANRAISIFDFLGAFSDKIKSTFSQFKLQLWTDDSTSLLSAGLIY
ncbi:MAG: hypothetical protein ACXWF8_04485 [Methylobacter sp.]